MILPLLALLVLPSVFATAVYGINDKPTVIGGIVYNSDHTSVVEGASVVVTCNNVSRPAFTASDGTYSVAFSAMENCDDGDTAIVVAEKDDLYGVSSGAVHDYGLVVNVAIIDVVMTPEFGVVMGVFTLVASAGIFFYVRRN